MACGSGGSGFDYEVGDGGLCGINLFCYFYSTKILNPKRTIILENNVNIMRTQMTDDVYDHKTHLFH